MPTPVAPHEVGALLVAAHIPTGETSEATAAAAEPLVVALRARLGRWIGGDAFDTLLERALANARREHAVLRDVRWQPDAQPRLAGLAAASAAHSSDEVRAGLVAILDGLASLLGRFIGDDLAARLLVQDAEGPDGGPEGEP